MSKEHFEALEAEIQAISPAEVKNPNMPVDVFLQEAADLKEWSTEDQLQLEAINVATELFSGMEQQIGALRYTQSIWNKDRYTKEEARQEWDEKSPAAYDLKNEIEHSLRYAFRKRSDLLNKVKAIEDGSGDADMVQDLNDLAELGRANLPLLQGIGFDEQKLDIAVEHVAELSVLLAKVNGEKLSGSDAKVIRDRAFTLLKRSTDEIREAGKYLFWKNKERKKGYYSKYLNKR